MRNIITTLIASVVLTALLTTQATAALITTINFTVQQVNNDVIVTANGSLNLTGLTSASNTQQAGLGGSTLGGPFYRVGDGAGGVQYLVKWDPAVDPSAFGTSALVYTSIAGGDRAGFDTRAGANSRIFLTSGSDGQDLSGTATFQNTTLAALGLAVGDSASFRYFDTSGNNGGIVNISAIPEPTALLLVGSTLGLGLIRRRRS